MVAIGGYFIYHSFAGAVSLPTGANDLVLEYDTAPMAVATAVPRNDVVPLRVYGSGLAICANTGSLNKEVLYYSTQLSKTQLDELTTKIVNAGFLNLKISDKTPIQPGTTIAALGGAQDTISLNLQSGLYEYNYSNNGPKPAAYAQAEQIIKQFCGTLNTPYIPGSVTVVTKEVADTALSIDTTNKPSDVQLPTDPDETAQQTISGQQVSQTIQQAGRKGYKRFAYQNKVYETSTLIKLPNVTRPQKPKNITKARNKNIAEAAATPSVKVVLFCATDACSMPRAGVTLNNYATTVQSFYTVQLKKQFNLLPSVTINGTHPASYYRTCNFPANQQQNCPTEPNPHCRIEPGGCTPSTPAVRSTFFNSFNNISSELASRGLYPTAPTLYVAGFPTGARSACGYTDDIPGKWSLVDFTDPQFNASCQNTLNFDYEVAAHELGHIYGLNHTSTSEPADIMTPLPTACQFPSACSFNTSHISQLRATSNFQGVVSQVLVTFKPMLDVFARKSDGNITTKWYDSVIGWAGWGAITANGAIASAPSTASAHRGDLHLFARSTTNSLIHANYKDFKWSAWENLSGNFLNGPASVSWGKNRYDVFVRGTDNKLYQKYWNGLAWSSWIQFSGKLSASPAVSSWGVGRLDVFIRNQNNAIQTRSYNGTSWSGWKSLGGNMTTGPTAVSWGPNHIDVFALGAGNALMRKSYDNGVWSATWQNLGNANLPTGSLLTGSPPSVASPAVGKLDIVARSTTSTLLHRTFSNNAWGAWEDLGTSGLESSPAAAIWK